MVKTDMGLKTRRGPKVLRTETMKGPAESGETCSVESKKNSEENSEK